MNTTYGHIYKRNRPMTEAEIQQSGADRAEAVALAAQERGEGKPGEVQFYRETFKDGSDEIITLCPACAREARENGDMLEHIDKAGDWDECGRCEAQNVPGHWHG